MASRKSGFDSPDLFREDTLTRIRCLEAEINEMARRTNRIIEEERLPVKRMLLLHEPEEDEDRK